jgi:hypothetical protein
MNQIRIDKFGGINKAYDAHKIEIGEFVDLKNASVERKSIIPIESNSLFDETKGMPVPVVFDATFSPDVLHNYDPTISVFTDTFTDSSDTHLKDHVPDSGGEWKDPNEYFKIVNNQLGTVTTFGMNTNFSTYIDLSAVEYTMKFDFRLPERGAAICFSLFRNGSEYIRLFIGELAWDRDWGYLCHSALTSNDGNGTSIPCVPPTKIICPYYKGDKSKYILYKSGDWLSAKIEISKTGINVNIGKQGANDSNQWDLVETYSATDFPDNVDVTNTELGIDLISNAHFWLFKPNDNPTAWNLFAHLFRLDTLIIDTGGNSVQIDPAKYYVKQIALDRDIAAYEMLTLFVLVKNYAVDNTEMYGLIYKDDSGNLIDITESKHTFLIKETDDYRVWRGFQIVPNEAIPSGTPFWIGIYTSNASEVNIFCDPSADGWYQYDGVNLTEWGAAHPGTDQPIYMLIGSSIYQSFDDIVPLVLYNQIDTYEGASSGINTTISNSFTANLFSIIKNPLVSKDDSRIIARQGKLNAPYDVNWNTELFVYPKTNIVLRNGIIAVTTFGAKYCVPISIQKQYYNSVTDGSKIVEVNRIKAISFNGNIVLTGCGSDKKNHKPVYVDLQSGHTHSYTAFVPDSPKMVEQLGLAVLFISNYEYPFRVWYSNPGQLNTFAANQLENLSLGEPITNVSRFQESLLIFTPSQVKILSGVLGESASLKEIGNLGTNSFDSSILTKAGVFFIVGNFICVYNGAVQMLADLTDFIDTSNIDRWSKIQMASLDDRDEIIMHLSDLDTEAVVFNYTNRTFYKVSLQPIIMKNFWDGNYQKVLFTRNDIFCSIYRGGEKFSKFGFETGWIDPNKLYQKKHFDRLLIDYSPSTNSEDKMDLFVDVENGNSMVYNDISVCGTKEIDFIEKRLNSEGNRIKIRADIGNITNVTEIQNFEVDNGSDFSDVNVADEFGNEVIDELGNNVVAQSSDVYFEQKFATSTTSPSPSFSDFVNNGERSVYFKSSDAPYNSGASIKFYFRLSTIKLSDATTLYAWVYSDTGDEYIYASIFDSNGKETLMLASNNTTAEDTWVRIEWTIENFNLNGCILDLAKGMSIFIQEGNGAYYVDLIDSDKQEVILKNAQNFELSNGTPNNKYFDTVNISNQYHPQFSTGHSGFRGIYWLDYFHHTTNGFKIYLDSTYDLTDTDKCYIWCKSFRVYTYGDPAYQTTTIKFVDSNGHIATSVVTSSNRPISNSSWTRLIFDISSVTWGSCDKTKIVGFYVNTSAKTVNYEWYYYDDFEIELPGVIQDFKIRNNTTDNKYFDNVYVGGYASFSTTNFYEGARSLQLATAAEYPSLYRIYFQTSVDFNNNYILSLFCYSISAGKIKMRLGDTSGKVSEFLESNDILSLNSWMKLSWSYKDTNLNAIDLSNIEFIDLEIPAGFDMYIDHIHTGFIQETLEDNIKIHCIKLFFTETDQL